MLARILYRFLPLLIISSTPGIAVADVVGAQYFDLNIKPIFQSRCIQCHSCYNSPCQLNVGSAEGLDRGLVKNFEVFSPGRLKPAPMSRLGIDRKSTEAWRNFSNEIHFRPVTQDTGDMQKNIDASLILKTVTHKKANASLVIDDLANPKQLSENSRVCPDVPKALNEHLMSRPNAGMPYGLPALQNSEIQKIKVWTEMGSPRESKPLAQSASDLMKTRFIEGFLNAYLTNKDLVQAKRQSLVSRYIYEHLFLAHIYLQKDRTDSFYRLIRSRTACNSPDEIATRRPWDDTAGTFFYCLKKDDAMVVNKTHMPYLVDENRIKRWSDLFYSQSWSVSFKGKNGSADVAPREDSKANNPFLVFKDIPAKARYQFLLDDAQYHVMTFIKGPVCKGNTAVNSIDEQFYVFFLKPESDLMVRNKRFSEDAIDYSHLPAQEGSGQILGAIRAVLQRYDRNQFRSLRNEYYGREFPRGYSVNDIWNGKDEGNISSEGPNENAALTVFRHEDSAAVVKGLVGATSKTAFVLDYSIFERIYYNLVVGFDVYGDATHQVHTRLYMSYTKMEAEENFLSFLPRNVRPPMRRSWYLKSATSIAEQLNAITGDFITGSFPLLGLDKDNQVPLPPLNQNIYDHATTVEKLSVLRRYRRDLVELFKERINPAVVDNNQLNPDKPLASSSKNVKIYNTKTIAQFETELAKLSDRVSYFSKWVTLMPSASILVVEGPEGAEIYTLIRNKEHLNIASMTQEKARRNEALDSMIFYKGILSSYPNFTFWIRVEQGRDFLEKMVAITDHASYEAWTRTFGNPRSGPGSEKFWPASDRLHQLFQQKYPLEYGALDFNRYGIDYRYNGDETGEYFSNLPPLLRRSVSEELEE